jgi:hypothetical protein
LNFIVGKRAELVRSMLRPYTNRAELGSSVLRPDTNRRMGQ